MITSRERIMENSFAFIIIIIIFFRKVLIVMDCPNCKNNIAKDRTGDIICIISMTEGCNIEYNQTREKLCNKEVTKEGCLR